MGVINQAIPPVDGELEGAPTLGTNITSQIPQPKVNTAFKSDYDSYFSTYQEMLGGKDEMSIINDRRVTGEDEDDIYENIERAKQIKQGIDAGYTEEQLREQYESQQGQLKTVEDLKSASPSRVRELLNMNLKPGEPEVPLPDELVKNVQTSGFGLERKALEHPQHNVWMALAGQSGLSEDDARRVTKSFLNDKLNSYKDFINLDNDMDLGQFMTSWMKIRPNVSSIHTRVAGLFGNEDSKKVAIDTERAFRLRMIEAANNMGVELEWQRPVDNLDRDINLGNTLIEDGQWMAKYQDEWVPADPGFWNQIESEKLELGGAIMGGLYGARATPGNWLAKLGGSIFGAAAGGAVFSIGDTMREMQDMHEELTLASVYANSDALNAAEASALGDVLVLSGIAPVKWLYRGGKKLIDMVAQGNKSGAAQSLVDDFLLPIDQAEQIIADLEKVTGPLPGTGTDKRIAAHALTTPGGEEVLGYSGSLSSAAQRHVRTSVDQRARDVEKSVSELSGDVDIDKLLKQDLMNYTADVKYQYRSVVEQAASSPHINRWSFDINELGVLPVIKKMENQIDNMPALQRYQNIVSRIEERTDGRSFADLIDLRQLINSFRFGRGFKRATEQKTFKNMINKIDGAIEAGSEAVMENPQKWRDDFSKAKADYAKMKTLEKNVLHKTLTRPGVQPETIEKAMSRYILANDSTWVDVMEKLPKAAKDKAEASVMNVMVKKHTGGEGAELKAIDFPSLAEDLEKVNFTGLDNRKMKSVIRRLGNIFKNDMALANQSSGLNLPKDQSFLTVDPVARMKFAFMSKMFNYTRRLLPSRSGNSLALLMKAADLLDQPLNSKAARDLMEEVGSGVNIKDDILEMQRAAVQESQNKKSTRVKYWESSTAKTKTFKGEGPSKSIQQSRVATEEIIAKIQEIQGIHKSDLKATNAALKKWGYQAKMLGSDRMEML